MKALKNIQVNINEIKDRWDANADDVKPVLERNIQEQLPGATVVDDANAPRFVVDGIPSGVLPFGLWCDIDEAIVTAIWHTGRELATEQDAANGLTVSALDADSAGIGGF